MLSVNYNPSVLKAQNNLTSATSSLTRSLERMSTGYKINSAKDDAAGMFVATNLTTQIRGLLQARNNANDGISYISTGSESLMGMGKILNRIRDLAVQGANGVYDTASRDAMQAEADELTKELYRIKNSTVFNGQNIFGDEAPVTLNLIQGRNDMAILNQVQNDGKALLAPPDSKTASTAGLARVTSVDEVPAGYTAIYTADDLDNVRNNLSGKYILMGDIDLSGYDNWDPIGKSSKSFQGTFDGNGHVIKNLKIDRTTENNIGLFGRTEGKATIKNVGLENVDVKGINNTGGLVGEANGTTITNSYAQGIVSGTNETGGLVGYNNAGAITNSYFKGTVSGRDDVGGLVGGNPRSSITNSFAQVSVLGKQSTGGLAGWSSIASITNSYVQGKVSGTTYVGGLTGSVTNLVTITNSYAQGTVSGTSYIGGLSGSIGSTSTITNSFWDKEKSGMDKGIGLNEQTDPTKVILTGLTTEEIEDPQFYKDLGWDDTLWDFSTTPPSLKNMPGTVAIGNLRLQIGANGDKSSAIHADTLFKIGNFSVDFTDEEACRNSIETVDGLLEKINTKISDFGAVLNRLDSIITAQTTSIENLTASRSTIQDADIAEESALFVKSQILQQTTASLLTQAKTSQSSVIRALIGQ